MRRCGTVWCLLTALLLTCAGLVSGTLIAGGPWFVAYEKALNAQERGEWQNSITYLNDAIAEKSIPKLKARTYGMRFVNYFPYFHLGVAYYRLGDRKKAIENFDLDVKYGEIQQAEEYASLRQLRAEAAGDHFDQPAGTLNMVSDSSAPGPSVLEEKRGQVPWYVNYETALAYVEFGDWLKAIENLKRALAGNEVPRRYARTYGMWFISYLPYYYLGTAYYNQGLWQFALHYLETSEHLGETRELAAENARLHQMMSDAKSKSGRAAAGPVTEEVREILNLEISEAISLFSQEDYDGSRAKFQSILQLDPYNSVARSYLRKLAPSRRPQTAAAGGSKEYLAGTFEFYKGRYDKAVELLSSARVPFDRDPAFHAYLGAAYASQYLSTGKSDNTFLVKAREEFARTLELDPDFELDNSVFSNDVVELFQKVKTNE